MQAGYGLKTPVKLDWTELKKNRDAFILRLNGLYQESAANAKVEVIKGHAAFVAPRVLECGGQKVTATHILIASGSRPSMPKGVEGIEFAKTSDDFFLLEEQPETRGCSSWAPDTTEWSWAASSRPSAATPRSPAAATASSAPLTRKSRSSCTKT